MGVPIRALLIIQFGNLIYYTDHAIAKGGTKLAELEVSWKSVVGHFLNPVFAPVVEFSRWRLLNVLIISKLFH